jgi:hypothetical protein
MLGRAFGPALFAAVTAIENQQTHSFLALANTALMFALMIVLLFLLENMPWQRLEAHSTDGART